MRWVGIAMALAGSACAQTAAVSGETVMVEHNRGSLQCGSRGTPPEQMQLRLQQAGIAVVRSACGQDGRASVAMCGAADGQLNLFEIPARQLEQAQALGFRPRARATREQPCPAP